MRATILALTLVLAAFGASAQDLSGWPRMDILELLQPRPEQVNALIDAGWIVDIEHPPAVRVYATEGQRAQLDRDRVPYLKIGQQPDPPALNDKANLGQYHSYDAVTERLQGYAAAYPAICRLQSIGKSVEGRDLWAIRISDNPEDEEDEPEFKYVSTIHGDEPVGTELCLYLTDLLLTSYGNTDAQGVRLTQLVDTTEIWILPLMNPDGRTAGTRYNKNGYDLNRIFPSYVLESEGRGNIFDGDPLATAGREVEVQRVMEWTAAHSFVLSANIHTGALLVNYPLDEANVPRNTYAASPDDALFVDVSLRYSTYNTPMYTSDSFENGISNGSDWYTIYGGMQDWNYRYVSCNEVTLELSNTKFPNQSTLPTFWEQNRESMLHYMESVHIGIRGVVTDACTGEPLYAKVSVAGNAQPVYTDPDVGDYHRMLLPGSYTITVSAPGYTSATLEGIAVGAGAATRADVALQPQFPCAVEGEGTPDGEGEAPQVHSSDPDGDHVISLSELLRTIQLFGAQSFQCDANSEDGYGPFGGDCLGCAAHSIDYRPRDCVVSLSELLRGVQIFNAGGYTACPGNDEGDGFCPNAG